MDHKSAAPQPFDIPLSCFSPTHAFRHHPRLLLPMSLFVSPSPLFGAVPSPYEALDDLIVGAPLAPLSCGRAACAPRAAWAAAAPSFRLHRQPCFAPPVEPEVHLRRADEGVYAAIPLGRSFTARDVRCVPPPPPSGSGAELLSSTFRKTAPSASRPFTLLSLPAYPYPSPSPPPQPEPVWTRPHRYRLPPKHHRLAQRRRPPRSLPHPAPHGAAHRRLSRPGGMRGEPLRGMAGFCLQMHERGWCACRHPGLPG